ncbi:unnamed protein product [Dracunculus medinensis]|uniref:DHC_N1 domain-containing protein n=1 Tax=Dracunculus medinensis TaxID=318479 RepID=A0A0N4UBA0_DRAME|nr:unnamed protein product [Dracunculus medinensis]
MLTVRLQQKIDSFDDWRLHWIRSSLAELKGILNQKIYRILQRDPGLVAVLREALNDSFKECIRLSSIHKWNCRITGSTYGEFFPSLASHGRKAIDRISSFFETRSQPV